MGIIATTPTGYEIHDTGGPGGAWSCGDDEGRGGCGKCWIRYERPKTGKRGGELKRRLLPCWHLARWFAEVADGTISNYFTLTEYGLARSETCECGPNGRPPWIEPPRPPPVKLEHNSAARSKEKRARKFRKLQQRAVDLGLSDDPTQGRDGIERAIEAELERRAGERQRAEDQAKIERAARRAQRSAEEQARIDAGIAHAREVAHVLAEDRRRARETGEARQVYSRAEVEEAERIARIEEAERRTPAERAEAIRKIERAARAAKRAKK